MVNVSIYSSLDTSGHQQTESHKLEHELLQWVSTLSQVSSLLISHTTSHAIIITSSLTMQSVLKTIVFFFFCFFLWRIVHEHYPNANGTCQKIAQDSQHSSSLCPEQPVFTAWVYTCLGYVCSTEQTRVLALCLCVFMSQPGALCCAGCTLQSHSDGASCDSCQYGIHVLAGLELFWRCICVEMNPSTEIHERPFSQLTDISEGRRQKKLFTLPCYHYQHHYDTFKYIWKPLQIKIRHFVFRLPQNFVGNARNHRVKYKYARKKATSTFGSWPL